ncbi:uncharacterized protein LOC135208867 [Macrobrachium nipponense]|uniref:uncharacterized protein LOC135208867 n=1 Tax=Macrobrachium nipponense TaxID=159736 RepID=UPI0030C85AA7
MELSLCQDYIDKIETCLPLIDISSSILSSSNVTDVARSLLKQPVAPLPKFRSVEGEDFLKFITEFEGTTKAFNYPDRDLLLLLKQQVEGRGKVLLGSLEADKQHYADAKELLISAFASTDIRKNSAIKKITALHLKDGEDPFLFISKLRSVCESVETLNISVDEFIRYFAWDGLNDSFQRHLIQITGKTHPALDEIKTNFFTACERYENDKKVAKGTKSKISQNVQEYKDFSRKEKAVNLAVEAVTSDSDSRSSPSCSLCLKVGNANNSHFIYECSKFPSPTNKVQILKSKHGCVKCGQFSHESSNCHFRFRRRCFNCRGWHMSYLCESEPSKGSRSKQSDKVKFETPQKVNSGVAVLLHSYGNSVLPTFSFSIGSDIYRGLRDSGSQSTFITRRLAEEKNLKTINSNVRLTVSGFNGNKEYYTKIVEVPVKIGSLSFIIFGLVVPDISIALKLPLLG